MAGNPRSIAELARLACIWEVSARKAGNVCPGHEFPDLTVNDFLLSADAIAPVLDLAPTQPLGLTILRCIEETRKVVKTNTNLGIVLLLAPLASVPLEQPLESGVADVLKLTTIEDSRNVYAAIRLAKPSGLGTVSEQDVSEEPTLPLRDAMALAKDRDLVATQYDADFALVFRLAERFPLLVTGEFAHIEMERGILDFQLWFLANHLDSLIVRKIGVAQSREVQKRAAVIVYDENSTDTFEGRQAIIDFDAWLRTDNHVRNPGTTADLIAAALFVALREKQIALDAPFVWADHPMK